MKTFKVTQRTKYVHFKDVHDATRRLDEQQLKDYAKEFSEGNLDNKDAFILNYAALAIMIGSKYCTNKHNAADLAEVALVALCAIPLEISEGRYKFDRPIDVYVKTRINTACTDERRRQNLISVDHRAIAEKGIFKRVSKLQPKQKIGNYSADLHMVEILPIIEAKPDLYVKCKPNIPVTTKEAIVLDRLQDGYTLTDIAKEFETSVPSVSRWITKLKQRAEDAGKELF